VILVVRRLKTDNGMNTRQCPWDERRELTFSRDIELAEKWINTFPTRPDFASRSVVEVGCGYGALCVRAAAHGAAWVVGVELDVARAAVARGLVDEKYPALRRRIEFSNYACIEAQTYDSQFDLALSQNAFEHYQSPTSVLARMLALLKPGGYLYAGFGPLWHSPYGSHLRWVSRAPWAHLWAPESLIRRYNRLRPHQPIMSFEDIGLNSASLREYRRMFFGLDQAEVVYFGPNLSIRHRSPTGFFLVEALRTIPFLKEYLTASVFVVIRKRAGRGD